MKREELGGALRRENLHLCRSYETKWMLAATQVVNGIEDLDDAC